jgi:hypothetical protein
LVGDASWPPRPAPRREEDRLGSSDDDVREALSLADPPCFVEGLVRASDAVPVEPVVGLGIVRVGFAPLDCLAVLLVPAAVDAAPEEGFVTEADVPAEVSLAGATEVSPAGATGVVAGGSVVPEAGAGVAPGVAAESVAGGVAEGASAPPMAVPSTSGVVAPVLVAGLPLLVVAGVDPPGPEEPPGPLSATATPAVARLVRTTANAVPTNARPSARRTE